MYCTYMLLRTCCFFVLRFLRAVWPLFLSRSRYLFLCGCIQLTRCVIHSLLINSLSLGLVTHYFLYTPLTIHILAHYVSQSFTHQFTHSRAYSIIYSLTYLSSRSFFHKLINLFTHSVVYSLTSSFTVVTCSLIFSLTIRTNLFNHSLTDSLTHSWFFK